MLGLCLTLASAECEDDCKARNIVVTTLFYFSGRIPKMVLRGKDTAGKTSGVKGSIATVDIVIFVLASRRMSALGNVSGNLQDMDGSLPLTAISIYTQLCLLVHKYFRKIIKTQIVILCPVFHIW